mmetsp:Transcript_3047/g.6687  ORF Transcript_3047/g.6687 Transcript_3047/m.6687 type:complete len:845 (+) Transcript_3047:177-2711(+)|eukprot:CAMPEP_0172320470 /NCGR_PEP_ID=MMETSP1058-20130122/40649_1 /TAXON_ID=83371 /ORGANISM="Detonula confervacea, Strain CCMP 353" /LENGTH=844 /DNA_ID=CAMNT_0013035745 /DNA_START=102 /DNA_END=2636 /DNA_ORIENTATION=+
MSFAEQLAARAAAKKRPSVPLPSHDDGNNDNASSSLADSIRNRAAERSASDSRAQHPKTKEQFGPRSESMAKDYNVGSLPTPINKMNDNNETAEMSFRSAIHAKSKSTTAQPKHETAEVNKNDETRAEPYRMSFGSAIKAKSKSTTSNSIPSRTVQPKPKYRELEPTLESSHTAATSSTVQSASISNNVSAVAGNHKRESFNSTINSHSENMRQLRRTSPVEDDNIQPPASPKRNNDNKSATSISGNNHRSPVRNHGGDITDLVVDDSSHDGNNDGEGSLDHLYLPPRGQRQPKDDNGSQQLQQEQASATTSTSSVDYKVKADNYKSENKKLRKELLKAKLEEVHQSKKQSSTSSSSSNNNNSNKNKDMENNASLLTKENDNLRGSMISLQEQYKQLEIKLWERDKVQEENTLLMRRMSGLNLDGLEKLGVDVSDRSSNKSGGLLFRKRSSRGSDADKSVKSFMSHDDLVEENVRLTQILLDIGELEELEKIRTGRKEDEKNDMTEENVTILHLQQKLTLTESELAEVTELKNAEIEVLRKQLNRAENIVRNNGREQQTTQDAEGVKEKHWCKEREGLREEIRRLNVEISSLKGKYRHRESVKEEEQEELDLTSRYNSSNGGAASTQLDSSDVASLQSIIAMMRQTIDQSNHEKELIEQRLTEEQERSQMELHAFAKTLEGVDDLRNSAESMSREIRRIKVKGYRPTRSDLFGGMGTMEGARNFGELTAAVEASESMEEAIRLIESQNDAMEERRRMGVVANRAATTAASSSTPMKRENFSRAGGVRGLSTIPDDIREGGFLSFWNSANGSDDKEDREKKEEKKKKSKRKSRKRDGGSVLTSFF